MKVNFISKSFLYLIIAVGIVSCFAPQIDEQETTNGFNPDFESDIDSILGLLTLEEKIYMIHGNGMFSSGGVERLGIPDLLYTDGPNGVREELEKTSWTPLNLTSDSVTFFPTGTALAATWNDELAYRYGQAIGSEANARGKDILLGPGVNIIRTPLCGRNYEYFTEDPYLNVRMACGYINGVQSQDVAACIKHFALNNQEYQRGEIDVTLDERAMHEIYLPVYKAAIEKSGVMTFMAAYNKVDGHWMSENDYLLNNILKNDWQFKGMVMSDWGGTHTAVKAALSGLDVEMGGHLDKHHFASLTDSVKAGLVSEKVIDDKVRRILRISYNVKKLSGNRVKGKTNTEENTKAAYDIASESIVLLKNDNNLLPLNIRNLKSIAIIGENAIHKQAAGGFGAGVKARYEITSFEGIKNYAGNLLEINYAQGYRESFSMIDTGGRWPYRFPDTIADQALIAEAVALAKKSDIAVVFAGTTRNVETEAVDRESLRLPFGQDELIKAVCAVNPRTIVVVVAGAACDLSLIKNRVPSILFSWFNGSEAGNAISDVIFGKVNPSGKLPFTIPYKLQDIGAHNLNAYPGINKSVNYEEGFLVGYRWFDTKKIEPAFPFGYGLSYTSFKLTNLKTDQKIYSLDDEIILNIDIQNTGERPGKETIQVYVKAVNSKVSRPEKELKAFKKILVPKAQKQDMEIRIKVGDLAYYDVEKHKWIVEAGTYLLKVGTSSVNTDLEIPIQIE